MAGDGHRSLDDYARRSAPSEGAGARRAASHPRWFRWSGDDAVDAVPPRPAGARDSRSVANAAPGWTVRRVHIRTNGRPRADRRLPADDVRRRGCRGDRAPRLRRGHRPTLGRQADVAAERSSGGAVLRAPVATPERGREGDAPGGTHQARLRRLRSPVTLARLCQTAGSVTPYSSSIGAVA